MDRDKHRSVTRFINAVADYFAFVCKYTSNLYRTHFPPSLQTHRRVVHHNYFIHVNIVYVYLHSTPLSNATLQSGILSLASGANESN